MQDVLDPLIARDALINTAYLQLDCLRYAPLKLRSKLKYEFYHQRGDQEQAQRDQRLFALVTKADYALPIGTEMTLQPKWKQLYLRQTPAGRDKLKTDELSEIFFLVDQYKLTNSLWLESGVEYEIFRNLIERPDPIPPGYNDDFDQLVLAAQFANESAYLGYKMVANVGGRWERKSFRKETETNTVLFIEVFAGVQEF